MIKFIQTATGRGLLLIAFLAIALSSCRDDKFDAPPSNGVDPDLTANITISKLKDFYRDTVLNQLKTVSIDSNWVIAGIVIADDSSGNLYKNIVIDDGTAGMTIRIDRTNYWREYPVGRRLFIKLKGLVMGSYAGLMQIGGYIDYTAVPVGAGAIPSSLISRYIVPGTYNNTVTPYDVSLGDLASSYKWQSRLVKISNVQFSVGDTSQPYADNIGLTSVNRLIEDCYSGNITLRSSGYADFAGNLTPTGSGSVTAVFGVYNSTAQLTIRYPRDVNFNLGRFVVGTCPPPPATQVSIASIRSDYSGPGAVGTGRKIIGIVISDGINGNTDSKNMFIQDSTGGIVVRFSSAHSFAVGDSVEVNVGGQTISEYNGLLEIGGTSPSVPLVNATKLGTGTVTPRIVTVSDIINNMSGSSDTWESTLVKIQNVTSFSATTFGTTTNITDATGTVLMYTRTAATFSGATIMPGATSVTCVISDFNGAQVFVRTASDVQ